MFLRSKKSSLLILGITAVVCSRVLFFFFDDPEGPNLLVVFAMAAILYFPSLAAYLFISAADDRKRLWLAILVQILLAAGLYLLL